jgi:sensor histidine kinase YesM
MSSDKIEAINNKVSGNKSVGLININSRLLYFYRSGLLIQSEEGKGTTVSFKIPKEEK